MTWYQLWKRLGKQPLYRTQHDNIIIVDKQGIEHKCRLEYYDNGSYFKLIMED